MCVVVGCLKSIYLHPFKCIKLQANRHPSLRTTCIKTKTTIHIYIVCLSHDIEYRRNYETRELLAPTRIADCFETIKTVLCVSSGKQCVVSHDVYEQVYDDDGYNRSTNEVGIKKGKSKPVANRELEDP